MPEKLLLHSCCGVCSGAVIEKLKGEGFWLTSFFYNPNIYPKGEYVFRKAAMKTIAKNVGAEFMEGFNDSGYGDEREKWLKAMQGLEKEPEGGKRCEACFEYRLLKTAQKAKELDIKTIATTLSISPHKNTETINRIGNNIAKVYDVKFLDMDLKPLFQRSREIAIANKIYFQKYCGCEFSKR